jgi:hypothetical protein
VKAIVNWLEDQHAKISQAVCEFTGDEICGSSKRTNIARRNQTGSQLWASQASIYINYINNIYIYINIYKFIIIYQSSFHQTVWPKVKAEPL